MSQTHGSINTTPDKSEKGFNWGKLFKWAAIIDLSGAIVLTVLGATVLNALAGLVHYHGVGKIFMMVFYVIVNFFVSLFIMVVATCVLGGGTFVVLVVIAFFSGGSKNQPTKATMSNGADTATDAIPTPEL